MASPLGLFGRQRSVHEILGGGIVADIMLWRRKNVTIGILVGTLSAWVVFEKSGYTLLSLVANVLLLLISIFFVWSKMAGILNRSPPPIPELHLSEEVINGTTAFLNFHVNKVLSVSHDVALGKYPKLFYHIAACLWLISAIGGLTDFLTLGYTGLLIVLVIPALYERYENYIDRYIILAYEDVQHVCERIDVEYLSKLKMWIMEKKKNLKMWIMEKKKLS